MFRSVPAYIFHLVSKHGFEDRDVSLLMNVAEIRLSVGGKWTSFRKQIPKKIATGKTVETERGSSENSIQKFHHSPTWSI